MNKLELAGRPGNLTPEDFGGGRIVSAAVLAAVGLLVGFLLANPVYLVISLAVGAILGHYAPAMWLQQKVDARRAEIQKGLPDAMDLLATPVDAGLGFAAALAPLTHKHNKALPPQFPKVPHQASLR